MWQAKGICILELQMPKNWMIIMNRIFRFLHQLLFVLVLLSVNASVFSWGDGEANKTCLESERQALLKFKWGLTDHCGILSSWGIEQHRNNSCKWRGVHCSKQTGHVVKINPTSQTDFRLGCPGLTLTGNISSSLLSLQHLKHLDLSLFSMDGKQIPTFIGSLSRLRYLNLSSANFGGRIPFQLGNLSNLQYLNIANNGLNVSRLAWLSHLHKLKYLLMYSLDLRGSTDLLQVISGLPSLKHLNLGSSLLPITDYPSLSLVNTSSTLAYLDLFSCGLSNSAYDWLFNVSSNLHTLYLYNNHLKGPIPDHAFWNMTSLVNPDLSFNQISTIPRSFQDMCSLRRLNLRNNNLTGQLPWALPQLLHKKGIEGVRVN